MSLLLLSSQLQVNLEGRVGGKEKSDRGLGESGSELPCIKTPTFMPVCVVYVKAC